MSPFSYLTNARFNAVNITEGELLSPFSYLTNARFNAVNITEGELFPLSLT